MADKQSRLAEIYKAEKSRGGGIASTLGKRALEKMDPRQFFNQKGFMAAALPSLFKSYSATPGVSGRKLSQVSSEIGQAKDNRATSFSTGALETKLDSLTGETRELKIHSKIAAKNSESLPIMARDMNLMRQNITKLVKLQGGTAASRADMFFMKSGERESAYENRFIKEGGKSKTPTQVDAKPKEEKKKGIFDSILDFLPTIFKGLLAAGIIGQFLKDPETFKIVKEFATKVLIKFFDGVTATFNLLTDLFDNEDVQKSIRDSVSSIFGAIAKFFSIKLTTFSTPFGDVDVTLGGAIAAVVGGFALFKGAMFGTGLAIAKLGEAAALAAGRIAMGGGGPATTGPSGGKGPNKGPNKGGGKGAALLALTAMAAPFALSMFNKKPEELTEEEIQAANEAATKKFIEKNGREPTENDLSNVQALEQSKSNIKDAALTVGVNAVGAVGSAYAVSQSVSGMSTGSKVQGYNTSAKRFTDASGKFASAKDLPKGEMIKKFMDFAVKAQSKGWTGKLYGKLALRLGQSIAIKAAGFIGGLAVPGIGTAVALISLASLAYDAYNIYEAIFGENGILDELEKEDKLQQVSQTPPKTPTDTTSPTPAPYNAAADSQAANPTKSTPVTSTPAAPSTTPTKAPTALDITASTEGGGRYDLAFGDVPKKDGTIVNVLGKSKNFPQLAGKIIMTPQDFSGKPLTEMTLAEVQAFQEYRNREAPNTNALGKYGFMRTTLFGRDGKSGLVGQLKLPMNTIFSPDTQELLQATMREGNAAALRSEGVEATDANLNLANSVGAKGAAKLLKPENANRNALEVLELTGAAAYTNPHLNRLSKDVVAETYSKYDAKGMAPSSPSYDGTVVASAPPSPSYGAKGMTTPSPSYGGTAVASQSLPDFKMPSLGTLAAAAPSVGDMITSATSAFGDITRAFDTAMASVTNITNNNTQASAAAQQSQGNLPSVYDDVFLNLFQRVT